MHDALDLEGPKRPAVSTPARLPASIRRTLTLDGHHPQGMEGPTHFDLRGRDLVTGSAGEPTIVEQVTIETVADPDGVVGELTSSPPASSLAALVGMNTRSGWRRVLDANVAGGVHGLHYTLLDALGGWAGLARFGSIAGRGRPATPPRHSSLDICAGWRRGATIDARLRAGLSITQFERPVAPELDRDDPAAWHACDPIVPYTMRRRRRLDVRFDGVIVVDAMFRDSFGDPSGEETVLHEYDVTIEVDPATHAVRSATATPRVLPWYECPWAAGSVQAIVGHDVRSMRSFVADSMRSASSCTHLNELVRAFADVADLATRLGGSHAGPPATERIVPVTQSDADEAK